jgi:hypothetical protein
MRIVGLRIDFPQLHILIELFHVMLMEDSSDLVADELFLR